MVKMETRDLFDTSVNAVGTERSYLAHDTLAPGGWIGQNELGQHQSTDMTEFTEMLDQYVTIKTFSIDFHGNHSRGGILYKNLSIILNDKNEKEKVGRAAETATNDGYNP